MEVVTLLGGPLDLVDWALSSQSNGLWFPIKYSGDLQLSPRFAEFPGANEPSRNIAHYRRSYNSYFEYVGWRNPTDLQQLEEVVVYHKEFVSAMIDRPDQASDTRYRMQLDLRRAVMMSLVEYINPPTTFSIHYFEEEKTAFGVYKQVDIIGRAVVVRRTTKL